MHRYKSVLQYEQSRTVYISSACSGLLGKIKADLSLIAADIDPEHTY